MAKPTKTKASDNSEFVEKYGIPWPKASTNDLNIELACYREPLKYPTGHPTEFHFKNAFRMLWPESVFAWGEFQELMAWAWCSYSFISVMGCTSSGKTFSHAHFALLDYLADPKNTSTVLATTKFSALRTRIFGDLMIAIRNSTIADTLNAMFKTTCTSNELKFQFRGDAADQKFLIEGVAIDKGDMNAGKLRGQKSGRLRRVVDEAQDVSEGVYLAFENAMGSTGFKGVLLTNPVERNSSYAEWSKPKDGWGSIDDATPFWENKRGITIHLDGRRSTNVLAKKTVVPYMLTWEYFRDCERDSVAWHMFCIGFFPPDGMVAKIWPSNTIERARRSEAFDFTATPCAALDPAFDSDDCVFIAAEIGTLRDGKACCCARESIKIQTKVGPGFPEKDYQVARECIRLCKERGIEPENFIMDITGNARGVYAIMRNEWAPKAGCGQVQGIYYGGEATERPLRTDDVLPAKEQVKYFVSELWFRASYLARDGSLCGLENLNNNTVIDLDARRYTFVQKLMVAESKKDLKARINRSPDFGDCFCQLGELMVRKGLLGGNLMVQSAHSNWSQMRERSKRSQKRYTKEYSHGSIEV